MGTLFVDKLDPQSGTSLELGSSGDTITIPSGATIANSGTATGFGGTNLPAFSAYLSNNSDQSISDSTSTKIQFDAERFDTAGTFDTTNYKYVVPSGQAGKYLIILEAKYTCSTANTIIGSSITLKVNGSDSHSTSYLGAGYISGSQYNILGNALNVSCVLDLSVSDYLEGFAFIKVSSGTPKVQEGNDLATFFQGFKLVE